MKIVTFVLVLLLSQLSYSENTISRLIDEGVLESTNQCFSNIDGSSLLIQKYSLNEYEQSIIGVWPLDIYSHSLTDDDYGPGISITFLPNRLFYASQLHNGSLSQKVVGEWKVVDINLQIRFIGKAIYTKGTSYFQSFKFKRNLAFYTIFNIPDYEQAFLNEQPYNWTTIPRDILLFYSINHEDKPRFRILFDTLGTPPGDISVGSRLSNLLLNRRNTVSYYLEIIDVW